jgi:hypothetical protein
MAASSLPCGFATSAWLDENFDIGVPLEGHKGTGHGGSTFHADRLIAQLHAVLDQKIERRHRAFALGESSTFRFAAIDGEARGGSVDNTQTKASAVNGERTHRPSSDPARLDV